MSVTSPLKIPPEEGRDSPRKALRLLTAGKVRQAELQLEMYNISHTGFLAKVTGDLQVGQILDVELTAGNSRKATPVWLNEGLAGFTFLEPITSAMLSSAFLKGDFTQIVTSADEASNRETIRIPDPWINVSSPRKYSLGARVLILIGLAAASWAAIIALIMALI